MTRKKTLFAFLVGLLVIPIGADFARVAKAGASVTGRSQLSNNAMNLTATGFFHTQYAGGRWWIVSPTGTPFYMSGVDHVSANPDTDQKTGQCPYCETIATKYPSTQAWAQAQIVRMRSWGFNTIGPFSDYSSFSSQMPYTVLLSMASGNDWFAPSFVTNADQVAQSQCAPLKNDPNLVGYYTDSELHWGPDWRSQEPVLDDYLNLPPGSPGRVVAEQYVGNPSGFLYALATRYFQVTTTAIREADPNHMILGIKAVAQLIEPQLLEAASHYVDAFSIDDYQLIAPVTQYIDSAWPFYLEGPNLIGKIEALVDKPIIIGEYSYRAADSGLTNSWPPIYPTYQTQGQRAAEYRGFVSRLYEDPYVIGDNWFEYVDEPYNGRFDGEDSNFGILSTSDIPYSTMVNTMTVMHSLSPANLESPPPACMSWQTIGLSLITGPGDVTCNYTTTPPSIDNVSVGGGFWAVSQTGAVTTYGSAEYFGGAQSIGHQSPVVSIAATIDANGYWLATQRGGVFSFGDAQFLGSAKGLDQSNFPIQQIVSDPDGNGYWLVNSSGQVYSFGNAPYLGGLMPGQSAQPVIAMGSTQDGNGYWIMNSSGQIFSFGDASFFGDGTTVSSNLTGPLDGTHGEMIAASFTSTNDSRGYWIGYSNGQIQAFGDASPIARIPVMSTLVSIVSCPTHGVWLAYQAGQVVSVDGATQVGLSGPKVSSPIVAIDD